MGAVALKVRISNLRMLTLLCVTREARSLVHLLAVNHSSGNFLDLTSGSLGHTSCRIPTHTPTFKE